MDGGKGVSGGRSASLGEAKASRRTCAPASALLENCMAEFDSSLPSGWPCARRPRHHSGTATPSRRPDVQAAASTHLRIAQEPAQAHQPRGGLHRGRRSLQRPSLKWPWRQCGSSGRLVGCMASLGLARGRDKIAALVDACFPLWPRPSHSGACRHSSCILSALAIGACTLHLASPSILHAARVPLLRMDASIVPASSLHLSTYTERNSGRAHVAPASML
jgi:hypothetical protein